MARRPVNNLIGQEELALRTYIPNVTCARFHQSNAFFRGIRGPFGSGKSVACCMEIMSRALEQAPYKGVRRFRAVAIRNTYQELLTTTLKTWMEWVPRALIPVRESVPIAAKAELPLADGTILDFELLFVSMDRPEDARKAKSLDLTGIWLNEASELPEDILTVLTTRAGRYPPTDWGGTAWRGIIADTNSPNTTSWWYRLAEQERPDGYEFFDQPPAMIDLTPKNAGPLDRRTYVPNDGSYGGLPAENVEHHSGGFLYYTNMVQGKSREWIDVFIMNKYGSVRSGKVVYPEYVDSLHHTGKPITASKARPLLLGWDFGLTPTVVIGQLTPYGGLNVIKEVLGHDEGVLNFIRNRVKPLLSSEFTGFRYIGVGDPAGSQRTQTTEDTCFRILRDEGLECNAAPTNEFVARREAVVWFLTRLIQGRPAFQLSSDSPTLRDGFLRAYHYRKLAQQLQSMEQEHAPRPEKNSASHPHDALQYICLYLRAGGFVTDDRLNDPFFQSERERQQGSNQDVSAGAWT